MSIIPQINPFRPYIEQHLSSLVAKIEEWLAGFEKTLDDVTWWEMTGKELKPYQFFGWKIHVVVMFAGSEEKHENTFIWSGMEEEIR